MLYPKDNQGPWIVFVDPNVVAKAVAVIEAEYFGVARKDMLGWLGKFLTAVQVDPMAVLGAPPMQIASNLDLMIFPGDRLAKVSGMAHVYKSKRWIRVYEIYVQKPENHRKRLP